MSRCSATTAKGSPCKAHWVLPSGLCHNHDPEINAAREARRAREEEDYQSRLAAMRAQAARAMVERHARARGLRRRRLIQAAEHLLKKPNATESEVAHAQALLELVRALDVPDNAGEDV